MQPQEESKSLTRSLPQPLAGTHKSNDNSQQAATLNDTLVGSRDRLSVKANANISSSNMVNTYVVAPNFSMAPPPRLYAKGEPLPPSPSPSPLPAAEVVPAPAPTDPYAPHVELQLGDVLTLPFGPEMAAINSKGRVPIDADDVYPTDTEKGFTKSRKELLSGRLGVWASLFAAMGVGPAVNVSVFLESRTEDVIEVGELQTRRFRITDDYIQKVVNSEAVESHLEKYSTSHIYIVSGMKCVPYFLYPPALFFLFFLLFLLSPFI